MKTKKIISLIFFCAFLLSAQSISDNLVLDVKLGDNILVAASRSGVSWRMLSGQNTAWRTFETNPFGAQFDANLDNILVANDGSSAFAVRLDAGNNVVSFLLKSQTAEEPRILRAPTEGLAEGEDGIWRDGKFFFTLADENFAVLDDDGLRIENRKKFDWYKSANELITLLEREQVVKFLGELILTTMFPQAMGQDRLFSKDGQGNFVHIHTGDVVKAAKTPDGFFYTLNSNGNLVVLDGNGSPNSIDARNRQRDMNERFSKANVVDFSFTDISLFGDSQSYSAAFATTRGIFYSQNEVTALQNREPFEHFEKDVPIRSGLREIYAEPGILSLLSRSRYVTFRYALDRNDFVTIDIFNYNLDFVLRIVNNEYRHAATGGGHSTDAREDRWDGTVNNRGGRRVSPGVYFFKITTSQGRQSAFGRMVVAQ